MPKPARTEQEINRVKERIIDAALHLVAEDGFRNLSMRKIASKMGITATTIYNYFTSKDELYFMIRIRGFELLYRSLDESGSAHATPAARIGAMIESYLDFGIRYPDYYDVMFVSRKVPKYLECVGTKLEPVAARDKELGTKTLAYAAKVIAQLHASDAGFGDEDARYAAIRLWCEMNGVISLHNSRLLDEVDDNVGDLLIRLTKDICRTFLGNEDQGSGQGVKRRKIAATG